MVLCCGWGFPCSFAFINRKKLTMPFPPRFHISTGYTHPAMADHSDSPTNRHYYMPRKYRIEPPSMFVIVRNGTEFRYSHNRKWCKKYPAPFIDSRFGKVEEDEEEKWLEVKCAHAESSWGHCAMLWYFDVAGAASGWIATGKAR